MIISFNGVAGSGKSTIAKRLAKNLGWPRYYIGGLRREKAKEKGLTLAEYNKLGETDSKTDVEVDEYQKELGKKEDNFVIEGRTSWYFIPHSIKIYLDVDPMEGAKRVFNELRKKDNRNEDMNLKTIKDVLKSHQNRKKSDKKRYKKYYNIDVYQPNNYDLVIDTTNLTIEQVFKRVYNFIKKKIDNIDK